MWQVLGTTVDTIHALLMAAWVLGLPLLFIRRWPRVTRAYALFAIVFITINQVSRFVLGECFLTTLARACWTHSSAGPTAAASDEWFTVRLAEAIFRLTPSHRSIVLVSEALILVSAVGALSLLHRQASARPTR